MLEKGLVFNFPCTPVVHLGLVELLETSKRNGASMKLPHASCRAVWDYQGFLSPACVYSPGEYPCWHHCPSCIIKPRVTEWAQQQCNILGFCNKSKCKTPVGASRTAMSNKTFPHFLLFIHNDTQQWWTSVHLGLCWTVLLRAVWIFSIETVGFGQKLDLQPIYVFILLPGSFSFFEGEDSIRKISKF